MKSLLLRFRQFIKLLPQRIWFLPSTITFGFLLLSLLLISLRYTELIQTIDQKLNFLALSSVDTARSILSTLTGGLISLVVFSFSMVMLVLNQATAQFSPRLLPGLISKRQHQSILGFYLGAIIYNLSVLARIGPSSLENSVPIIAVLLAIIFGVLSLVFFIAFINAISNAVRIDTILDDLYQSTKSSMDQATQLIDLHGNEQKPTPQISKWPVVTTQQSGYFLGLDARSALDFCTEIDIEMALIPYQGAFLLKGQDFVRVSKKLDTEQTETLLAHFRIDISEDIQADYMHGMHQMTEIAVKAMSPGINDPATALSAIDFLSALLHHYLQQKVKYCLLGKKSEARIWIKPLPFEEVLFKIFAPLRTYCTGDVVVVKKMLYTLKQLQQIEGLDKEKQKLLATETDKVKSDALERILNAADRSVIEKL